jgi:hypothetical protein
MTTHPLVVGLFDTPDKAISAARDLRRMGVPHERVSIVARSHEEEGAIARASGASPGSELEDSLTAARIGELGAHLLSAVALVMPGIGPIVADGPLAAGLAEAAGHVAGGVARTLERAGLNRAEADLWELKVKRGALLVGAHVGADMVSGAHGVLTSNGAERVRAVEWSEAD